MKKALCLVLSAIMVLSLAACGGGQAAAPAASEEKAAEASSDSGKKDYKIALVGGETSSEWYMRVEKGINEYRDETGINASFNGPATSDPTETVSLIKDLISQKVDALIINVDCQDAVEPALKDAREAGILVISTEGTGMTNRDYDVEPCDNKYYGEYMMQGLAKQMGEKGKYVVMVGDLTSTSHNAWADAAIAYQKENYPDMELIDERLESQVNAEVAYERAKEILKKYPDLGGILGCSSFDPLGASKAIKELGLDCKTFGNGTMLTDEEVLKDGTLEAITFWDPGLTAKAMCNLAVQILDNGGKGDGVVKEGMNLGYEGYDNCVVDGQCIYGNALVYGTVDNFDEYPF
ncbi:MAG: substrate-binding domain-containing protein [Lachnospiraceae bacterium]|nr:substrate-binding domain-containing protein [Lachnospiraceae bacterium]